MTIFVLLLFAVGGCSSGGFARASDEGQELIDQVIEKVRESFQDYEPLRPETYVLQDDSYRQIATIRLINGTMIGFRTLKRASPVSSTRSYWSQDLSTQLTFGTLEFEAVLQLNILGINSSVLAQGRVGKSTFDIDLTVERGFFSGCNVRWNKAGFTLINDVDVELSPLGFYNQLKVNGRMKIVEQTVHKAFYNFNTQHLCDLIKTEICKARK